TAPKSGPDCSLAPTISGEWPRLPRFLLVPEPPAVPSPPAAIEQPGSKPAWIFRPLLVPQPPGRSRESSEGNDIARRALLDPLADQLIHLDHHLLEIGSPPGIGPPPGAHPAVPRPLFVCFRGGLVGHLSLGDEIIHLLGQALNRIELGHRFLVVPETGFRPPHTLAFRG